MDKLFIPKECVIEGEAVAIVNEGDIVIENQITPRSLESRQGGVKYHPQSERVRCDRLTAKNGVVEVEAEAYAGSELVAQSAHLKIGDCAVETEISVSGELYLEAGDAKVETCRAGRAEIKADHLTAELIEVDGEAVIHAEEANVGKIVAQRVVMHGSLACRRIVAAETVVVESGKISIKYLDAPAFHASPEVSGIVVIANSEEVRAEGVRGFLHPSELDLLTEGGGIPSVDLSNIEPLAENRGVAEDESDDDEATDPDVAEPAPADAVADEAAESPPPDDLDEYSIDDDEDTQTVNVGEITEEGAAPAEDDIETQEMSDQPNEEALEPIEVEGASPDSADPAIAEIEALETYDATEEIEDTVDNSDTTPDADAPAELGESLAVDESADDSADDGPSSFEEISPRDEFGASTMTELAPDDSVEPIEVDLAGSELEPIGESEAEDDHSLPEVEGLEEGAGLELDPESFDDGDDQFEEYGQMDDVDAFDLVEVQSGDETETEELSEEDLQAIDAAEELLEPIEEESASQEEGLTGELVDILDQVKAFFPEDNYPNFLNQLRRYVEDKRFSLFAKQRNQDAVLASFDKLNHPEISRLARRFFARLDDYNQEALG